jgi:hypothetical protein
MLLFSFDLFVLIYLAINLDISFLFFFCLRTSYSNFEGCNLIAHVLNLFLEVTSSNPTNFRVTRGLYDR